MVVFTCSHCGEPVQKPKVLKHYQTKCRNRNPSLSCMDCFKDFQEMNYLRHVNCSSARKKVKTEQDYQEIKSVTSIKKNEQKRWMKIVKKVVKNEKKQKHSAKIQNILQILPTNKLLPKSEVKFLKFMKGYYKDSYMDHEKSLKSVWNIISVKLSNLKKVFDTPKTPNVSSEKHEHNKLKNHDKKAARQSEWFTLVGNLLMEQKETAPAKVVKILKKISSIPTLPRKQQSFLKFVKRCNSDADDADIQTIWNLLSVKLNDGSYVKISPKPKEKKKVSVSTSGENNAIECHSYQTWLEQVEKRSKKAESDPTVDKSVRIILHKLTFYKNVPKKYKKFYNVIKRVLENSSDESIRAAYEYVSNNSPHASNEQTSKMPEVCHENTKNGVDEKDTLVKRKRGEIKNDNDTILFSNISKVIHKNTKIQVEKNEDVEKIEEMMKNKNEELEDIDNDDDEIPNSQETKVIPLKATPKRKKKLTHNES